jgi:hypothetical protein
VVSSLTWAAQRSAAASLIATVAIGLHGCSPEGTGTIKVSPDARSSIEPPGREPKSPRSAKQAKVRELEEEAKKKDPKRF